MEAARAVGAGDLHIILFHILPNCLAPMIVQATIGVATAILDAAGLSFIGLGIQPPIPDWGGMLSAGRQYIRDYCYISGAHDYDDDLFPESFWRRPAGCIGSPFEELGGWRDGGRLIEGQ